MQIVILAAGRGTRMKELTDEVPKPMLKIKGKPLLAYKLEALPAEIDEVILVIGYLGNQIQAYFGNSYAGKKISYVTQCELDGSGGAVHLAKDLVEDDFLVMMGDDLYAKEDVRRLMKNKIALLGFEIEDQTSFGILKFDERGNLEDIVEKPKEEGQALANIGLYKLTRDFFTYPLVKISETEYGLPQTLVQMKDAFEVKVEKATAWFPVGNPTDLKAAENIIDKFI